MNVLGNNIFVLHEYFVFMIMNSFLQDSSKMGEYIFIQLI